MKKTGKRSLKSILLGILAVVVLLGSTLGIWALTSGGDEIIKVPSEDEYSYINPEETKAEPDEGFVIDGVLDEEAYKNCNWLKLQNTQGGAGVDIAMTTYYGKNGMYIVYDVTESSRIYVNPDRPTYLNSCIEMYLASSKVANMSSNEVFEIDMLPTGELSIRQRTGKDNWVNVASTDDLMARLGATTKGGPVNTEECSGYYLELFIPWQYLDYLGLDVSGMMQDHVYINPIHITSHNYEGTESGTDRYWYAFATQIGSDGWNDVAQYFRFGKNGVLGTAPVELVQGAHYTITGNESTIPGMLTTVKITPDSGYALNSILVNGEEYIQRVSYGQDGSVTLTLRGRKDGLKVSAGAEAVTSGNKTLSGTVQVNKLGGDKLDGVLLSYKGPGGEKPITFDKNGRFELKDLEPGYYVISAMKTGYASINRGIYLNRDAQVELTLEYEMFVAEDGYNWILDGQNDGVLNRFGGSGKILSVDSYKKFGVEATFRYDTDLAAMSNGDTFLQQRSGIQIKFSNGVYWRVDLMLENGVYKVQYAKHNESTLFNWKTVHVLTEEEIAQYQSKEGIKLSILRDGRYAWVCLNGKPVAIEVLDADYSDYTARVGFEGWIANQNIEEMKFNIFENFSQNLKNFYFTTNTQWDISGQLDGKLTLPGGGTGAIAFYDRYTDFDITLNNVKEHDTTGSKPGRTDILLEFDTNGNGTVDKSVSFGIVCTDPATKTCWVQTLGNGDNYIATTRIKGLYKLSAAEAEKYLSTGVELRVIRKGTNVFVFLDGEEVAIWDLTQNNSGVTADTTAKLSVRHYDAAGTVSMGFKVTGAVNDIQINKIFKDNENWDLTKQNLGWIEVDGVEKIKGIVSLPGGGTNTSLALFMKYLNIDLTVTAKEHDTTGSKPGRTDILFEFDLDNDGAMDKNVSFGIVQLAGGRCVIQTLGWSENHIPPVRINELYELDYAQTQKYLNEGIDLRVVRYGENVYIYLDGMQVAVFDLTQNNSGVKADSAATVFVRHYDAVADQVVIPFTMTDRVMEQKVEPLSKPVFKPNYKWDLSQQDQGTVTVNGVEALKGVVSLPGGGTNAAVFFDQFTDIDLTIIAKENKASAAANGGRTDILFEFENGKNVSFGLVKWSETSSCILETLGNSTNHIPASRKNTLYTLNAAETNAYLADGVELRVVRYGTNVFVFLEGKAVAVFDLTQNNSGVTADMKATVSLRHYDAVTDQVDIPFTVADEITRVTITDESVNGKVVSNRDTYVIGSEIVLSAEADGYNLIALKVDGKEVTVAADGTYSFIATKSSYTVEGEFKKAIFESGFDTGLWDVSHQYEGYVTVIGGGGSTNQPIQFVGQYQNIDLTLNARDYADSFTKSRTEFGFEFDVDGDGVIDTSKGDQTVTFGVAQGDRVQTRGGTLLDWKTPYDLTSAEMNQLMITTGEIAAGDEDGLDLRVIRYGTTIYIFVEGRQVAICDLTKCANANGDTASGITADTKMFVYLRHYDDARTDGVKIPFTISTDVKPVTITVNATNSAVSSASTVNHYINNGRTTTTSDVHFVGEKVTLTVKPDKGHNLIGFAVDGADVTGQMVSNDDGTKAYSFVTSGGNHLAQVTTEQIKIFENNYDTGLWDLFGQYDGYVTVMGGGGATNKPLQFAGQYQNIDLTLNARDYADSSTASRTEFGFEFDVDGDGVIDTAKGDQTVTFGIAQGDRVQTRGGTLLDWKTPYDLTKAEKDQLIITAEELAAGNEDGLDLRVIRYGTTIYIFVEGKQVAICDLTKCAKSSGDTASGITADTKMFVYLRHYDDVRTDGVKIPFTISTDVKPVTITVDAENGTVSSASTVNHYVNNGRTTTTSNVHFVGEKVTLTMTPSHAGHIVDKLLLNGSNVTKDITTNASGVQVYVLDAAEVNAVVAEFSDPVFENNYDTSIWDISGQYNGIVVLPNGGGGSGYPLQFRDTFKNVDLSLLVRDYPNGDNEEDARTDLEFVFGNGETVTFGVVKTKGEYRIQTRGGTLLSWKTPYYITDTSMIDDYVVTEEEMNSGNLGGLNFRVVRYETEFYLYLNDIMVKGYDFSYDISADTPVTVYLRHYDDKNFRVEIPFTVTDEVVISDHRLFSDKTAVTDYDYSFAVIPDIQIVTENDIKNGEANLAKLFDWIIANKESKSIQYVFGLGDITENNIAAEWELAATQHAKLSAAGIPYSAIRGNHDLPWYGKDKNAASYTDDYTAYMGTDAYRAQFAGFYSDDNISNSWRTFTVGEVKYLMLTLDYGVDDNVLNWASDIIAAHPYHNVIITTHAYLFRDGTTLDAGDLVPPSTSGGVNDGDDMWNKLISKHENIVLVMCGHDPSESIVVNRSNGENGNVVTSMLIDAQDVEADEGSMGMVAMLYFSEDGRKLQVEYYSTAKEKYFMNSNQFSAELDIVDEEEPVVYGAGYVPVAGELVTSGAYAAFPKTIEITFSTTNVANRTILWGNCDGKTKDFINLELEKTSGLVYLNMTLNGTTYRHSFTGVQKDITATGKPVRLTLVMEDAAIKLYVNGELKQTRTASNGGDGAKTMAALWASAAKATLPAGWAIGDDLRGLYRLDGTIYDVAVWSDARTEAEVRGSSIEDVETAGYKDNLLAAYNFWAGYLYSEKKFDKDLSGNGIDLAGTLNVGTGNEKLDFVVEPVVYGAGYVPVAGELVTSGAYGAFPKTIEITFSTTNVANRTILWGNCDGKTKDFINLELEKTSGLVYLNMTLNGTTYRHSFTGVQKDITATGKPVRLTLVMEDAAIKLYVNGELKQTRTASNGGDGAKTMAALWASAAKAALPAGWAIGDDLRGLYRLDGTIYDVAVWSDARTADEIANSSIANIGTAGYRDNLLAAYDFAAGYRISDVDPFHKDLSGNGVTLKGTLNVATGATPIARP